MNDKHTERMLICVLTSSYPRSSQLPTAIPSFEPLFDTAFTTICWCPPRVQPDRGPKRDWGIERERVLRSVIGQYRCPALAALTWHWHRWKLLSVCHNLHQRFSHTRRLDRIKSHVEDLQQHLNLRYTYKQRNRQCTQPALQVVLSVSANLVTGDAAIGWTRNEVQMRRMV
jgi:hypothetical protein